MADFHSDFIIITPVEQSNQLEASDRNTLQQLGGILCPLCKAIFPDKKELDGHFASQHRTDTVSYSCVLCFKEFPKYKRFHDHCYRHVSGKRIVCKQCRKQISLSSYQLHLQMCHTSNENNNSENQFNCTRCPKRLSSFKELTHHLKYCGLSYNCTQCDKSYLNKSGLLRHMNTHTDAKNYYCLICNGLFKSQRSLTVHQNLQHQQKKNHKCDVCSKRFSTSVKLQVHMNTHTGARPYQCLYCDVSYADNKNRDKHMKLKHKPITCKHEDITLLEPGSQDPDKEQGSDEVYYHADSDLIALHGSIETVDGIQEYVCSLCPMRSKCRRSWLRHCKRSHLQYRYKCNSCSKIIVCPKPIETYEARHPESMKSFICDYCGAGFTDKGNLERHIIRVKHMTLQYECKICNKKFFSSGQLSVHTKTHNKPVKHITSFISSRRKDLEKLYKCQCCDKSFTYHRSRLRHMRTDHGQAFDSSIEKPNNKIKKAKQNISGNPKHTQAVTLSLTDLHPVIKKSLLQNFINLNPTMAQEETVFNTNTIQNDSHVQEIHRLNFSAQNIQPTETVLNKQELLSAESEMVTHTSEQISDLIEKSSSELPLAGVDPQENKIDEIDNEVLSYLDTYIHGNADIDILNDSINLPEFPDESTDLASLTADFDLSAGPEVSSLLHKPLKEDLIIGSNVKQSFPENQKSETYFHNKVFGKVSDPVYYSLTPPHQPNDVTPPYLTNSGDCSINIPATTASARHSTNTDPCKIYDSYSEKEKEKSVSEPNKEDIKDEHLDQVISSIIDTLEDNCVTKKTISCGLEIDASPKFNANAFINKDIFKEELKSSVVDIKENLTKSSNVLNTPSTKNLNYIVVKDGKDYNADLKSAQRNHNEPVFLVNNQNGTISLVNIGDVKSKLWNTLIQT